MSVTEPAGTRHGWLRRGSAGLHYRLGVAVRALAAVGGGYGVAALAAAALALYLPMSPAEAAITGTLVSFVVYACAVMWVFAVRSALRAWVGLAAAATLPGALLLWHHYTGSVL
jgi:hypothetical protein